MYLYAWGTLSNHIYVYVSQAKNLKKKKNLLFYHNFHLIIFSRLMLYTYKNSDLKFVLTLN